MSREYNQIMALLDSATELSNEELKSLKQEIVGKLKLNRAYDIMKLKQQLKVGSNVIINTPERNRTHRGQVLEGVVKKVNSKNAKVKVDDIVYNCNLGLLELV